MRQQGRVLIRLFGAALILALGARPGRATLVTYTGSDLSGRAASATFDTSGNDLVITLSNTSTADVTVPAYILTGVLFNLSGNPTLQASSSSGGNVVIAAGSGGYIDGALQSATDISSQWAYNGSISPAFDGQTQGVGTTGYSPANLFGSTNVLPGPAVSPTGTAGMPPDGVGFGLTSAGDNLSTENGGIRGRFLVKNSVVITLAGLPSGFDPSTMVTSAVFIYGTSSTSDIQLTGKTTSPETPAVPEPATVVTALTGLIPFGIVALRRSRRRSTDAPA